jgi:hypothetical protein
MPLPPAPEAVTVGPPQADHDPGSLEPGTTGVKSKRGRRRSGQGAAGGQHRWRRRSSVALLLIGIVLVGLSGLTVAQSHGYPNGAVAGTAWRVADKLPPVQSWLGDQISGLGWHPDPTNPTLAVRQRWVPRSGHWIRTVERVAVGSPEFCTTFPNEAGRCRAGQPIGSSSS